MIALFDTFVSRLQVLVQQNIKIRKEFFAIFLEKKKKLEKFPIKLFLKLVKSILCGIINVILHLLYCNYSIIFLNEKLFFY